MALSLNGSTGISGINGSAGTPALQGSDADTGIFFGADTASIATAGSERLIVDASGNINVDSGGVYYDAANNRLGVGNTAPRGLLHVGPDLASGATDAAAINLKQANLTASDGIYLERSGERRGYSIFVGPPNDGLTFRANNFGTFTTAMYLDREGKVGINTTTPLSLLDVKGSNGRMFIANGTTSNSMRLIAQSADGGSNADMVFESHSIQLGRLDSSGRLLLGTTSTANTCKIQLSNGNAAGPYIETGGTNRNANGLSKWLIFRHGYWGGAQEVASIGVVTTSSSGGSGHGYGNIVFYNGESGNGDSGSTSTERFRIHHGGKLTSPSTYTGTTTGGGPVYVESDGDLLRYTSSLKYKTDIETVEDARADAILNCRPVWYRSKCENDIKTEGAEKSDWGWYGFIAEEVAEIEPRLVNFATKDAVRQSDGTLKSVERDPADYEAEGVRYDNFVPLMLNLIKRQKAQIEDLEARLSTLEAS